MSTPTQLTPIQAGAAIALGFGLNVSAVAAEFDIHRSTLHNWMKDPVFALSVQTAQTEFQTQFRTQLAMLTRCALETLQEILTDPEAPPSLRLRAALAVLKQDWKLPHSTDFDTFSQPEDSLRNEMPADPPAAESGPFDTFRHPDSNEINDVRNEMPLDPPATTGPGLPGPFDTFRHPDSNEINDVRNEMAPEPAARPQPVRSHKIGRNVPCPCGSNLKYKRCCGK